ncbi:hypothetical protein, partial [Desulfovibrio sp.]
PAWAFFRPELRKKRTLARSPPERFVKKYYQNQNVDALVWALLTFPQPGCPGFRVFLRKRTRVGNNWFFSR